MLKKALTPKLSLLFVSVLLLQNSFAEDYTQWELPEGAKARLGKGVMWEIQYSPDSARLAVASSIGIWLYDTATDQEVALLTGTQVGSRASHSARMDVRSLVVGVGMIPSVCGMPSQVHTRVHSQDILRGSIALRSARMDARLLVVQVGLTTVSVCGMR